MLLSVQSWLASRIRAATSDQSGRTWPRRRAGRAVHLGDQVGGADHQLGGRAAPERALAAHQRLVDRRRPPARPRRACARRTRRRGRAPARRRHVCVDPPRSWRHPTIRPMMGGDPRPDAPCWGPASRAAPPRCSRAAPTMSRGRTHPPPPPRRGGRPRPTSTRRTGTRCRISSCSTPWPSSRRSSSLRTPGSSRQRSPGTATSSASTPRPRCSRGSSARPRSARPRRRTTAASQGSTP